MVKKFKLLLYTLLIEMPRNEHVGSVYFVWLARTFSIFLFGLAWVTFIDLFQDDLTPEEASAYTGTLISANVGKYGRFISIDGAEGEKNIRLAVDMKSDGINPGLDTFQAIKGSKVNVLYVDKVMVLFDKQAWLRRLEVDDVRLYDYWSIEGLKERKDFLNYLALASVFLSIILLSTTHLLVTRSRSCHL